MILPKNVSNYEKTMNTQLPLLAKNNISALYSVNDFMNSRGFWTTDRDIRQDLSRFIYELFQFFAWSDGALHKNEYRLLDVALEVDAHYDGHLKLLVEAGPLGDVSKPIVPGCLVSAALHDSVHETSFVHIIINHLENLALIIIMSDSKLEISEQEAFRDYFSELRMSYYASPTLTP
jgi:hypothetical protein